jgi:AraC-like DNA-binding protein
LPILLDTGDVDPGDRLECLYEAFSHATMPCYVSISDPTGIGYAQARLSTFGPAEIFQMTGTGLSLRRTERHVKDFDYPPLIALAVQRRTRARFSQSGRDMAIEHGDPMMVDLSIPYEFGWDGVGESAAFQAPYDEVGVPFDVIRLAAGRLPSSPLCSVVTDHILRLSADADALSADPAAVPLGVSTILMIRALITSAAGDERRARDSNAEALLPCILAYARQHLRERNLTPGRIAQAHHISLRHLYTICSGANIRIAEWILEQRLDGAKREIENPPGQARTIGATALRWGFVDTTHFGRRFRAAYGMSPSEFKSECARIVAQTELDSLQAG